MPKNGIIEVIVSGTTTIPYSQGVAQIPSPAAGAFKTIGRGLIKWVAPLFYYLITMLILAGVGLLTLYLKNATFGATPVASDVHVLRPVGCQ